MKAAANPSNQSPQSKANANHVRQQPTSQGIAFVPPEALLFEDKRPEAVAQRQLQGLANKSARSGRSAHLAQLLEENSGRPAPSQPLPSSTDQPPIQRVITLNDSGEDIDAAEAETRIKKISEEAWEEAYRILLQALDEESDENGFDDLNHLMEYLEEYENDSFDIDIMGALIQFRNINEYAAERENTEAILTRIQNTYGMTFSEEKSIDAAAIENEIGIKKEYGSSQEDQEEVAEIRQNLLDLEEETLSVNMLKGIEDALKRYAPILGARRAHSPRATTGQEITSLGVLNADPSGTGEALTSTVGKNIHLYEDQFQTPNKHYTSVLKTMIHELSHGLLDHRVGSFVQGVAWWHNADERIPGRLRLTLLDTDAVEIPPNHYADTNAHEDLAECTRLYLYSNAHRLALRNQCPERYAVMSTLVEEEMDMDENAVRIFLTGLENNNIRADNETQIVDWDPRPQAVTDVKKNLKKLITTYEIKAEKAQKEVTRLSKMKQRTIKQSKRLTLFQKKLKNANLEVAKYEKELTTLK